jgi:ABC-type nickel/cobalt efflux system permease component RcnA
MRRPLFLILSISLGIVFMAIGTALLLVAVMSMAVSPAHRVIGIGAGLLLFFLGLWRIVRSITRQFC